MVGLTGATIGQWNAFLAARAHLINDLRASGATFAEIAMFLSCTETQCELIHRGRGACGVIVEVLQVDGNQPPPGNGWTMITAFQLHGSGKLVSQWFRQCGPDQ